MRRLLGLTMSVAMVCAHGCDWFEGSSPTAVDDVVTDSVIEIYSGSFGMGASSTHQIGVGAAGTLEVLLTSLEPLSTLTVGLRIAILDQADEEDVMDEDDCVTLIEDSSARLDDEDPLSVSVGVGVHCVTVFDVGNVPDGVTVTYTIEVMIPGTELEREEFAGSFGLGEMSCHEVALLDEGSAEMTLTSLEPLVTRTVGMGIGTTDATEACVLFAEDRNVVVGAVLLATELDPGLYCTCVFDVGNVFPGETVTYTLLVEHP